MASFAIYKGMDSKKIYKINNINKIMRYLFVSAFLLLLSGCYSTETSSKLEQIKSQDILRVGILFNPTSYYIDKDGPAGFEHDLVQQFAQYLDVEIEFIPSYHVSELLPKLENGQVDILVGGLAKTKTRNERFRYSPPYMHVSQKLVYKQGKQRPTDFEDLETSVTVAKQTSHYEKLKERQQEGNVFDIAINETADPNELLEMVMADEVSYTIADSHNLAVVRRYFPDISVAFTVEKKQPLSWLLQNNNDDSLYAVLIDFFGEMHSTGDLLALEDRYFGHVESFNYVDTRLFMRAVDKVLPKYQDWFEEYAGELDWRLIAAQSYQESHWNPRAKSPTGVRGIMMLTQPTAKQFGVKSRLDAEDNIRGGSVYMKKLLKRIPDRISDHDKTWFALAAYNVGWGHVQDARRLTEQQGGDPDKWVDVKRTLPLLRQKRYYKKTRYGFARGDEAVTYVSNIRRYYDTLVWLDQKSIDEEKRDQFKELEELEVAPQIAQ